MMDAVLRTRIAAGVPDGIVVDWVETQAPLAAPYVILSRVSGSRTYSSDGPAGLAEARVQADCYGRHPAEAKTLAAQVRQAVRAPWVAPVAAVFVGSEADASPDRAAGERLHRVILDMIVHYEET